MTLMLDDLRLGETFSCGSFTLSPADIIDFATRYDPQPWHLSDELARETYFESLSASGVHTQAMAISLVVRALADLDVVAGGALNEARFYIPVRPDQPYAVSARWIALRPSASNPSRGVAVVEIDVHDAAGSRVMRSGITYIVRRRVAE